MAVDGTASSGLAPAERSLRQQLEVVHPDHERNAALWKMLYDLWEGEGGVRTAYDQIRTEGGQFGPMPNPLPGWKGVTYLDRYPRESERHFKARIRNAYYENYLRDIGETILGFMLRRPPQFNGLSPALEEWWASADGSGRPMEALVWTIASRMLVFGWVPVWMDRPQEKALSGGDAKRRGLRTTAIPLYPTDLTGWKLDEWTGKFAWAKIRQVFPLWNDPLGDPVWVTRWTILTRTTWARYESVDEGEATQVAGGANEIGEVPIVIFQFSEPLGPTVVAASPLQSTADIGRALYNRTSEKTDIMRGLGCPILGWPVPKGGKVTGIKAGTDAAVPIPLEGNLPLYLTIPASVCADYTTEQERLISAMYRQARSDFAFQSSSGAESGHARALRFQRQNTQLVQFGRRLGAGIKELARLHALLEKRDAVREQEALEVVTADDYDIRDLTRELEQAEAVARIGIGPTAMAKLKKQIRDGVVTLKGKELKDSNAEIDAEAAAHRGPAGALPPEGQAALDRPLLPPEEPSEPAERRSNEAAAEDRAQAEG